MTIDLDDLERKVRAMTAAKAAHFALPTYMNEQRLEDATDEFNRALRNAATELIAAARQGEARAQVTTLRTVVGEAFVACSEGRHGTARFLMQRALDSLDRLAEGAE